MKDSEELLFPKTAYGAHLTFDAESNGLYFDKKDYSASAGLTVAKAADRIWMCCHRDDKLGISYDFIDDEMLKKHRREIRRHNRQYNREDVHIYPISMLPKFWDIIGRATGHNSMKFDFPLIEKLLGYHMPRNKRWDTLLQSQTQLCDRDYVSGSASGPHSVESWALRINKGGKVEHEDWMNFSIDMYRRCWRDVEVQCDILLALNDEKTLDQIECNIDWTSALKTEHDAAYWISQSEKWGFPIDTIFAYKAIDNWDEELAEIEDRLLPVMPFRRGAERCGTKVNWETYAESMLKFTDLTKIPLGWCWAEDSGNKPQPIWKPFKKDGSYAESVITYWSGKDAQDAKPEEPERFQTPSVKDEKGKVVIKAIRARKARPAVEAKDRVPDAYEDDAGLTEKTLHRIDHTHVGGPFTRIQWDNYNLGSDQQVKEFLTKYTSWEPTEYTDKGNPKLTDDSYDSIKSDLDPNLGDTLKYYLITRSRRTNVKNFKDPSKGWLNNVREDGRVTPINHTMGTPTARSRHSNIVNVPSGGALHGETMRRCWTAYEGGMMIGSDASGLEMRMLAHEMDDPECTREIVEGDIHTVIWDLIPDFSSSRGGTKGIEYCLIYGGSDGKLGSLADVDGCREEFASVEKLLLRGWEKDGALWRHKRWNPKKESMTYKEAQDTVCGSIIRRRIMEGLKPLGDCIERITHQAEKGYLVGIDGRKLTVRSTHSALNLKLQSTGAILMKVALVRLMDKLEEEGYIQCGSEYAPNSFVELFTFYHDEYQFGVPESLIEEYKTFKVDVSGFDITSKDKDVAKKAKKEATAKIASAVSRFQKRQRRSGKIWSEPHINLKAGTAEIVYCKIGQFCVEGFEEMSDFFKLSCAVTGNYMYGKNWYETH